MSKRSGTRVSAEAYDHLFYHSEWNTETCLKRILEVSPIGIAVTDRSGNTVTCSRSFEVVSGRSREDTVGRPPFDWVKDSLEEKGFVESVLLNGRRQEFSGRPLKRRCDGAVLHLDLRIEPLQENGNGVGSVIFVMESRKDAKAGEVLPWTPRNLEMLSRILTQSSRDLDSNMKKVVNRASEAGDLEMLAQVLNESSHDFNNMLAPVTTYPELIRVHYHDRERVLKYLQAIETAAKKLTDRNRDLLILGRRGRGRRQTVDINQIIERVLQEEGCVETLAVDNRLSSDPCSIQGGHEEIHRAIVHLVRNARAAMGDRGVLTVKTENYYLDHSSRKYRVVDGGEFVKITISDTGPGIRKEILDQVRNPSAAIKKKDGVCLGMKVVCSVVRDHSGYLDVEIDEEKKGTSYFMYLPIARRDTREETAHCRMGRGETILVIDDDPDQQTYYRQTLSDLGYRVIVTRSVREVLDVFKCSGSDVQPVDLVIMDTVLKGGIDEVNAYRAIKNVFPDQKSILISGFTPAEKIEALQKLGAGPYLKKPVTVTRLSEAVRRQLDFRVKATMH